MKLNTNSPDYHEYIRKRDSRLRVRVKNRFIKLFRTIKYGFKNS